MPIQEKDQGIKRNCDGNYSSSVSQGQTAGSENAGFSPPTTSLPKGGGAINDVSEKFAANPVKRVMAQ